MSRVKRGVTNHARHKKVLKAAEGFYGRRKSTIRTAKAAVDKAGQYAYRDRRNKKRNFRALWIQRINAAVREHGLTYGRFTDGLSRAEIAVDRKVLSDLAITEPAAFAAASPSVLEEVLLVDDVAEEGEAVGSLGAPGVDVEGSGTGDGVSADACAASMITTVIGAVIIRPMSVHVRRRGNRPKFTDPPRSFTEACIVPGAEE